MNENIFDRIELVPRGGPSIRAAIHCAEQLACEQRTWIILTFNGRWWPFHYEVYQAVPDFEKDKWPHLDAPLRPFRFCLPGDEPTCTVVHSSEVTEAIAHFKKGLV